MGGGTGGIVVCEDKGEEMGVRRVFVHGDRFDSTGGDGPLEGFEIAGGNSDSLGLHTNRITVSLSARGCRLSFQPTPPSTWIYPPPAYSEEYPLEVETQTSSSGILDNHFATRELPVPVPCYPVSLQVFLVLI